MAAVKSMSVMTDKRVKSAAESSERHVERHLERHIDPARLEAIARAVNMRLTPGQSRSMLDLGCGNGHFSLPLARKLDFAVTGVDLDESKLHSARKRSRSSDNVVWLHQDALALDLPPQSFDVVFLSDFLHCFDNPLDIIEQCVRVLKPGGLLVNHFCALEDVIHDADHKFFERAASLDVRRPARIQVEYLMKSAGLNDIASEKGTFKLCTTGHERLELVESKHLPIYRHMSEICYQRGLRDMKRYVESSGCDPWLKEIVVTTTVGVLQ